MRRRNLSQFAGRRTVLTAGIFRYGKAPAAIAEVAISAHSRMGEYHEEGWRKAKTGWKSAKVCVKKFTHN
jgi:hypothetical protein